MIDNAVVILIKSVTGLDASLASSVTKLNPKDKARVLYTPLGGPRGYNDDDHVGLTPSRVQLDVFTDSIAAARLIVDKLMARSTATPPGLDGYSGTVDATQIVRISFPESARSGGNVELAAEGGNVALCRLMLDMIIVYRT